MGAAGDDFKVDGSIIRVPSRESIALHRLNVTGSPRRNSLESRHPARRRGRGLRGSRLISVCSPPPGEVAEWSKAAVLKTVGPKGPGGSNPSLSANQFPGSILLCASLAADFPHHAKSSVVLSI